MAARPPLPRCTKQAWGFIQPWACEFHCGSWAVVMILTSMDGHVDTVTVWYSNVHTGNAGSSPCFVTSSVKCGGFCWKHTSNKALYPPSLLFHYSLPGYCTGTGTVQTLYCIYCIHTIVVLILTYDTTRHLSPVYGPLRDIYCQRISWAHQSRGPRTCQAQCHSEFVMEATDADFATEFVQQQMVITSRKHLFIQGPTIHLSSLRLFWGVAFCSWYWQRGC
ncbi:hypothetical protein VFPPC_15313 [Pochonia chlamydosporia 170]|uniref:Uncharacterized protein n=1 Tax=Pochonia chlamydosporia 170 TaxID=1380566 RepID=A0A179G7T3_METCM|nr:hypothetical protein VFPPC_15313 [Pochonia chlamydosporia 170]OAQ73491.1 hypothetical protein VFPPC_15313 [Pochonia chlamydosporia 170]